MVIQIYPMTDRPIAFCISCDAKKAYIVKAYKREITVRGTTFRYVHQAAYCAECGNEVYSPEINDANVREKEDAYRRAAHLITVSEVSRLLEKYRIGAGPLASLIGVGEVTINRYMAGQLPSREISEKLQALLSSPQLMDKILEDNREAVSPAAYKKCRKALDELLPVYGRREIDLVTRYLLSHCVDITPLALQKLLYYAQSFFYAFFGFELFTTPCQAWQHGPVYPDIYFKYREYGSDPLEKPVLELAEDLYGLTQDETAFLDCIIDVFGRYSGSFLRNLTHKESPWKEARGDLSDDDKCTAEIPRESIHSYFAEVVKQYNMCAPEDMALYVQTMMQV